MGDVSGGEPRISPGIATLGLPATSPSGPLGTLPPVAVTQRDLSSPRIERRSPAPLDDRAPVIRFAEALGCVPETLSGLALLHGTVLRGPTATSSRPLLLSDPAWPIEWRAQASFRHAALAAECVDELELVLRLVATWERADNDRRPWQVSVRRKQWADRWWVDHDVLIEAAELRRQALKRLKGRLPGPTDRLTDVGLTTRARAAIVSAFTDHLHLPGSGGGYIPAAEADGAGPGKDRSALRPFVSRLVGAPVVALARDDIGDTTELRNLVRVPSWCHPAAGDDPAVEDEIRLVLDLHYHGEADAAAKHLARTWPAMASRWPIGARVTVDLESGSGERREVIKVRDWAGAPARADASTEPPALEEDEFDPPRPTEDPAVWREDHDESGPDDATVVAVPSAAALMPTTTPDRAVAVVRGEASADRYEVVGYEVVEDAWAPVLAGDQLAPSFVGDPAAHPDLEPGTEIDVIVGAAVRVDRVDARILYRADGCGRFVLPDGPPRRTRGAHDVDPGLWAGERGFVGRLRQGALVTGTVVAGPRGSIAVSLVPTLTEHLQWAYQGVLPRGDGGNFPAWPAKITRSTERTTKQTARSGAHGEVTLAHHDAESGIVYRFNLPPDTPGLEAIEQREGVPLLVRVAYSEERVLLPGPLTTQRSRELEAVCVDDPKSLRVESGPPKTASEIVTSRPMSTEIRTRLLELDDDPEWRCAIWVLFTRSHVRRIRGVGPIGPFDDVRPAPVPLPGPARRAVINEVAEGMLLRGQVLPSTDNAVRIDLGVGMKGRTSRRSLPSPDLFTVGADVDGRVDRVDLTTRRIMLDLDTPYEVSISVPGLWQLIARQTAAPKEVDSAVVRYQAGTLRVRASSEDLLAEAARIVAADLSGFGATLTLLQGDPEKLEADDEDALDRIRTRPGVLHVNTDGMERLLVVAVSAAALGNAIDAALGLLMDRGTRQVHDLTSGARLSAPWSDSLVPHVAVPLPETIEVHDYREPPLSISSISTKEAGPLTEPAAEPATAAAPLIDEQLGTARVVHSDNDLRTIIEDLREQVRVEVDIARSTVLGRTELMAFLSGVSSAFVGGTLTISDDTVRVENRGRSTPRRGGSGHVRSYTLRALDEDVSTAVSVLRLGDGLRLTLPDNDSERELIMWFFVGVTETLRCAWQLSEDKKELMLG